MVLILINTILFEIAYFTPSQYFSLDFPCLPHVQNILHEISIKSVKTVKCIYVLKPYLMRCRGKWESALGLLCGALSAKMKMMH